jgi:hypothetical protein
MYFICGVLKKKKKKNLHICRYKLGLAQQLHNGMISKGLVLD